MKKLLSVLITALMLMQMFTFTVFAASAPSKVWWTGEFAGEVAFSLVSGVREYHLKLYKNNVLVADATHSFGDYDNSTGYHQFAYEIPENGSGTYRAEVGPDDGSGNYTSSGNYVYKKPSITLDKANVKYDSSQRMFSWAPVEGAVSYDAVFKVSWDGGENFDNSFGYACESDCYFNFWDNWDEEIEYLMEEIEIEAETNGYNPDDALIVFCVEAYPADFNDANPSYSDYVTFDGTTIPNDGNDNTGGTTSGGCTAQELVWGEGGLVSFIPMGEDAKTCIISLYKDDKMVDDTEYEIADYEMTFGVETSVFRDTIARLGNGEYKFSVIMADENFEPYDDKEYFSDIYVYKVLEKVDRSNVTDGKYMDGAKFVYDLGLMTNVYENPTANITKGELYEIVVKMLGAEETAKEYEGMYSWYSDVQTGTTLNGYVQYLKYNADFEEESYSNFGVAKEMDMPNVVRAIINALGFNDWAENQGGHPQGYLSVATSLDILKDLNIDPYTMATRELTAHLVWKGMEAKTHLEGGKINDKSDETLLYRLGYSKITGIGYSDQNTLTIDSGTLKDIDNLTGKEVTELEFENYDYDILALNGKDSTFYVKDNKAICGLLNYKASVKINNGDLSTSNKNVTLYLDANGYTKYKIEDGAYSPITSKVSYVLPSVNHGYQSVNVTFANDDETRTQKVSDSIDFINMHKLTYMADGKVFEQFEVGCGLKPDGLYITPNIEGYWFNGWEPLPPSEMPDEDVVVYAKLSPYTRIRGILTYNGEIVANKRVYIHDAWYTTGEDGSFTTCLAREGVRMINITYNNIPKAVCMDLSDKALDLGVIDITPTGTKTDIEENTVTSIAGLEDVFTQEDKEYTKQSADNSISVNVAVKPAEKTDSITTKEEETSYKVETLIDIDITKIKKGTENSETAVTETNKLLEFKVDIPENGKGKSSYVVLREHNGEVDMLTTAPNEDGEYIVINQDEIVIYAKKFSTYGIATKEVVSATKTDTGVSFEINLNEQVVKDNALMIVKTYNSRGVQLASKAIPVTATYSDTVTLECEGATGYKLLFFNGLANIKPVYVPINGNL